MPFGIVGAVFGAWLGAGVSALGAALSLVGSVVGGYIDRRLFGPRSKVVEGPRLENLKVQISSFGAPIPKLWGTYRLAGNLIWAQDEFREVRTRVSQDGVSANTYQYFATFAVQLCEGPIAGVQKIWAGSELIYSMSPDTLLGSALNVWTGLDVRIYLGDETQLPDPTIEATEGVGMVPAHRGTAYVVFVDMPLEKFYNRIPNLTFEVYTDAQVTGECTFEGIDNSGEKISDNFLGYGGWVISEVDGDIRKVEPAAKAVTQQISYGTIAPAECDRWDIDEQGRIYADYFFASGQYSPQRFDFYTFQLLNRSNWTASAFGATYVSKNIQNPFLLMLRKGDVEYGDEYRVVDRETLVWDDETDFGRILITADRSDSAGGLWAFYMAAIAHESGIVATVANNLAGGGDGSTELFFWAQQVGGITPIRNFGTNPGIDISAYVTGGTRIAFDPETSQWIVGGGSNGEVAFFDFGFTYLASVTATAGNFSNWRQGVVNGYLWLQDPAGTLYKIDVGNHVIAQEVTCACGAGEAGTDTFTRIEGFEWAESGGTSILSYSGGLSGSGGYSLSDYASSEPDRVRTGVKSLRIQGTAATANFMILRNKSLADGTEDPTDYDYASVSFQMRVDSEVGFPAATAHVFEFLSNSSAVQAYLALTPTGLIAVGKANDAPVATSVSGLVENTWFNIEARYAAGLISVRINGKDVLVDQTVAAVGVAQSAFGSTQAIPASGDFDINYDDVGIQTDSVSGNVTWTGEIDVRRMLPKDDGTDTPGNWTPSVSTIATGVTDDDGSTDYVLSPNVPSNQTVTVYDSSTSDIQGSIKAVQLGISVARNTANAVSEKVRLRKGTTVVESDSFTATTSYKGYYKLYPLDIETAEVWTLAALDDLEPGVSHLSSGVGREVRWSCAVLQVATTCNDSLKLAVGGGSVYSEKANAMVASWSDVMQAATGDRWGMIFLDRGQPIDVAVSDVIKDICEDVGLDPTTEVDTTEITDSLAGFIVDNRMTARSALEALAQAHFFDGVEGDGKIKMRKRTGTSVVSIPEADLGAHPGGNERPDLLVTTRRQELELPNQVDVVYADPETDYENATQYERRLIGQSREPVTIELAMSKTADEAKQIAVKHLALAWMERTGQQFALPRDYVYLEPADVVTVTEGGATHVIRIEEVSYQDGMLQITGKNEDSSVYVSDAEGAPLPGATETVVDEGPTFFAVVDTMFNLLSRNDPGLLVSAMGFVSHWHGAQIHRSPDGQAFSPWAVALEDSVIGTAVDALEDVTDPWLWDNAHTVTVDLLDDDDALESYTEAQILAGTALVAQLGDELIQWKDATENADGTWTLSGLLRGILGSEWATGTHAVGDEFVLLDPDTVGFVGVPVTAVGTSYFLGFSNGQPISSGLIRSVDVDLKVLKPLSPVHISGTRDGSNNLTIEWIRRSRINGDIWIHGEYLVPLGETSESYSIDILDGTSAATVLRTLTSTTESVTYTAAQQSTDGFTPGEEITCVVYQVSGEIGRGFGREETV